MRNSLLIKAVLLFGVIGTCSAIKAFEFYMTEPTWGPNGLTWFRKNLTLPSGTNDVSVCLYVKIHHLYTIRNFMVVLDALAMGVARWHGFSLGNVEQAKFPVDFSITFRQWQHVCFVIGYNLQLIVDGVEIPTVYIGTGTPRPVGVKTNFYVMIGMASGIAEPRQAATMAGYLSLPTVFFRQIQIAEAAAMAKCGAPPADNAGNGEWEFIWVNGTTTIETVDLSYDLTTPVVATTTQLTTGSFANFPSNLRVFDFANTDVCPPHPDIMLILFPSVMNYQNSEAKCLSIGGTLIDSADTDIINGIFASFKAANVQGALFLESSTAPCNCLVYEVISTLPCDDQVTHVGCKASYNSLLTLRGTGLEKYVANTMYFYPSVESMSPVFYSVNGWKIIINGDYLDMIDVNGNKAFSTVGPSAWAPGRKVWRPTSGIGSDLTLLLSMCNSSQFTCNNGLCIDMDLRCDGKDDCNDDSDETCVYLLPLAASYKKDRPPDIKTSLTVTVTLISVVDINVADNIIKLWLKMDSRWVDERVRLWLLNDDKQDNPLDASVLWVPSFRLENAIFKDSLLYSSGSSSRMALIADRVGDPVPILEAGFEGYGYDGILEKQEEFTLSYVCDFDLSLFPFGIYECRINISIINSGSYTPVFNETTFQQVSAALDLSLFKTSELRYQFKPGYRGANMLSLRLMVEAKFESYILTMFMPCWVIGVIGYLTLFYDKNNFSDRIMVTLSCLIVVAALLSQVSSTMPMSATSKAIDRFFLYFIIRLFVVYIHHAGLFFVTTWVKRRKQRLDMEENETHPPVALDILENKLNFDNMGLPKNKITPSAAVYVPANVEYKPPGYLERRHDEKTGEEVVRGGAKVKPWDDYYNWFGLIFGAIVDFAFAIMFIVEITQKRNEVYDTFYSD